MAPTVMKNSKKSESTKFKYKARLSIAGKLEFLDKHAKS